MGHRVSYKNPDGPSVFYFGRPGDGHARRRAAKLLCPAPWAAFTIGQVSSKTEFDWRPLTVGQAGAWASLLAAIEAVDDQDETMGEDDLREEFDDPASDFPHGSIAVYDGSAMIGYCVLTARCSGDRGHQVRHSGGVHPAYRGRGIGSALLGWADATAVPIHDDRDHGRPLSVSGRYPARLDDAAALFSACGYRPARWFLRMVADLAHVTKDTRGPAGIEIVQFSAERSADALLIRNEAFRDHWGSTDQPEQEWAHFIGYQSFRPALSFVAYDGSEPAGLVIGHEYEEYNRVAGVRDLYVPLVGTRRAARRRGIASALVTRALATARAGGFATATLDADAGSANGAVGIYERIGFTVQDTWVTQTKRLAA